MLDEEIKEPHVSVSLNVDGKEMAKFCNKSETLEKKVKRLEKENKKLQKDLEDLQEAYSEY